MDALHGGLVHDPKLLYIIEARNPQRLHVELFRVQRTRDVVSVLHARRDQHRRHGRVESRVRRTLVRASSSNGRSGTSGSSSAGIDSGLRRWSDWRSIR